MSITQVTTWTHPKFEHSYHGSKGGIFRTLMVSSFVVCLCSLIDSKRTPSVPEGVCHRRDFCISIGNTRWSKSTGSSLFFFNALFRGLPVPSLEWGYSPWQSWWAREGQLLTQPTVGLISFPGIQVGHYRKVFPSGVYPILGHQKSNRGVRSKTYI